MYCSYCGSHDHPYELCPKTWSGNAKRTWDYTVLIVEVISIVQNIVLKLGKDK